MKASGGNFSEGLTDGRLRENFGHPEMLPLTEQLLESQKFRTFQGQSSFSRKLKVCHKKFNAVTWQQHLDFSETSSIFTGRGSLFETFQSFYNREELWNTRLYRAEFLFQSGNTSMGQKKVKFKEVFAQVK